MDNYIKEKLWENGFDVPDEVLDYLPSYWENREKDLNELKELLNESNAIEYDRIARIAHKIKGNGASFGFSFLTELASELEMYARLEDKERIRDLIFQIDFEMEKVKMLMTAAAAED